jgi:3-hydroxyisobutyrate dehydrogenase-like beta-hydroxyacid dehydrogenase
MGQKMVEALVGGGHDVQAYDVSEDAMQKALNSGATMVGSCGELGDLSQVVILSLPGPRQVEAVVADSGVLETSEDLTVVDTSTIDPSTTHRMSALAAKRGVRYLDAPVLGRPDSCGSWTFPVGGETQALEVARPALEALASNVRHVGDSGAGHAVKLLNNLMFGAINAITAEIFSVADHVGVSREELYKTISDSGAATVSPLFRQLGPKITSGDYSPTFTVDLLRKDTTLAMTMAREAGAYPMVGSSVETIHSLASSAGYGAEDTSAVFKLYNEALTNKSDISVVD